MNENLRPFIRKITSGKFLFTIACAYVFIKLSVDKTLPTDKIMEVILIVLYAYFTKATQPPDKGTGGAV